MVIKKDRNQYYFSVDNRTKKTYYNDTINTMPSDKESAAAAAEKAAKDNRANQFNPNHPEFRGHEPGYQGKGTKANLDNHSRQLNTQNRLQKQSGSK
jgi:hypothetical protein